MKIFNTHYLRRDFRKDSLYTVIKGLETSMLIIEEKLKLNDWYDGIFAREELEPIIGMAFITCQNYINKSIADIQTSYFKTLKRYQFYEKYPKLEKHSHTSIQMIIALANYAKHEEEGNLRHHTTEILDAFGLVYINPDIVDSSPLFTGLEMIDGNWNLVRLADLVCDWREQMWLIIEKDNV